MRGGARSDRQDEGKVKSNMAQLLLAGSLERFYSLSLQFTRHLGFSFYNVDTKKN